MFLYQNDQSKTLSREKTQRQSFRGSLESPRIRKMYYAIHIYVLSMVALPMSVQCTHKSCDLQEAFQYLDITTLCTCTSSAFHSWLVNVNIISVRSE